MRARSRCASIRRQQGLGIFAPMMVVKVVKVVKVVEVVEGIGLSIASGG